VDVTEIKRKEVKQLKKYRGEPGGVGQAADQEA